MVRTPRQPDVTLRRLPQVSEPISEVSKDRDGQPSLTSHFCVSSFHFSPSLQSSCAKMIVGSGTASGTVALAVPANGPAAPRMNPATANVSVSLLIVILLSKLDCLRETPACPSLATTEKKHLLRDAEVL